MPEDTEPTPEPTQKRMTTADAARMAQDAMALAAAQEEQLQSLSEKITDLATRVTEVADPSPAAAMLEEDAFADQLDAAIARQLANRPDADGVDARIHEALQPLHDEVHQLRNQRFEGSPIALVARLEDLEQRAAMTQAAQDVTPLLARIAELEAKDKAAEGTFENLGLRLAELEDAPPFAGTPSANVPSMSGTRAGLGAAAKVLELMRRVTAIGKDKQANLGAGGRFAYRGIDQAMDAVGHAMREVGLILSTEVLHREWTSTPVQSQYTDKGQVLNKTTLWTSVQLTIAYTFVDPTDGSTHSFEMVGEGRDAADKGTSKAAAMALKYGLLQALMVPIEGLPDSDAEDPRLTSERPAQPPAASGPSQPPPGPAPNEVHADRAQQQSRAERAQAALVAIRNVGAAPNMPVSERQALLGRIRERVMTEGLGEIILDGATLNQHGAAAARTLSDRGVE